MRRRTRLVLFDLDGTLLISDGIGRRALDAAFAERFGWAEATAGVSFAGATDPGIVRDVLGKHGVDPGRAGEVEQPLLATYLAHLQALVAAGQARVRALAGAAELVADLARRDDVIVGVLTGNVEGGARIKVGAAGLDWSRFAVGAFGDEAPTRPGLLPVALGRARAASARPLRLEDAVVVGDTPRDVEVARAHGARAVAVATGFATRADLEAEAPCALLADLADLAAALRAVLGP